MPTAVSAPGKVLLAGGYLVLDRQYTGLVFGLSARIYVLIDDAIDASTSTPKIVVRSPQFTDAEWRYEYGLVSDGGGIEVKPVPVELGSTSISRNPFVETTLTYALSYISAVTRSLIPTLPSPIKINILADDDYYSHPSQPLLSCPRFSNFAVPLPSAHKTGLGSSATLVTALSAALLTHYLKPTPNSLLSLSVIHNLSQIAHCAAQGKIGSGFDVAAAVYGTCIYRRFTPSLLTSTSEPATTNFATTLCRLVNDVEGEWDADIRQNGVALPSDWALVLCDVNCGSATVGMVKRVQAWRAEYPQQARELWDRLQGLQEQLARQLANATVEVEAIATTLAMIRSALQEMSRLADVPIEPPEQTRLLDALTTSIHGVVGGVVPGAGGFDALVLLVRETKSSLGEIEAFLQRWREMGQGQENVRLLGTRADYEGVRREDAASHLELFPS